jgi:hypothetical protein
LKHIYDILFEIIEKISELLSTALEPANPELVEWGMLYAAVHARGGEVDPEVPVVEEDWVLLVSFYYLPGLRLRRVFYMREPSWPPIGEITCGK